jgi:hypothetical protein
LSPREIIQYCDDLETALREYQGVIKSLMTPGKRKVGIEERLRAAFHKVRDSYVPLEPILARRTRRVKRNGREYCEPWSDVPTFWGIRTVEDYEAVSRDLDFLMLEISLPNRNFAVHQELQGYFESVDSVRREAERKIRYARDAHSSTDCPNVVADSLRNDGNSGANSDERHKTNWSRQPQKSNNTFGKPPSEYEILIFRVSLTGIKQQEIAATMRAKTGIPCDQSKVSRAIKKVKLFLKRGNVLPDLSPIKAQKITVDPSKLEKGPRLDGRTPQR